MLRLCTIVAVVLGSPILVLGSAFAQDPQPSEVGDDGVIVDVDDEAPDLRAPSLWRNTEDTEALRERGGDLAEGLQSLPGTYATSRGGLGARSELTLRGASAGGVQVLFDGIPLNPVRGGGFDLSLMPAGLVERLEVFRGGSATRFGNGALGGALNVVPDLPSDGARVSANAGAGSFLTRRTGVAMSGGTSSARGLASVDWLSTSGEYEFLDEQGTLHTRENADAARLGGLLVAELEHGATSLRLVNLAVDAHRGSPGPSEFQETFDEARLDDRSNVLGARLASKGLAATPEAVMDGELTAAWRHGRTDYNNPDCYLRSPFPYASEAEEDAVSSSGTLSLFTSALAGHVGLDGTVARYRRAELLDDGTVGEDRFLRRGAATSAHVEWTVAPWLALLPAARLEWVEGVAVVPAPSFGVMVRPLESLQLAANVGRAWRAPSLDELYLNTESLEGDPGLRPEDAISADVGGVWTPSDHLRVELVAFYLDIDDLILFLPVSPVLYRAQNTGGAFSVGAESRLTLRPMSWLSVDLTYTLSRARRRDAPRAPLPGRPEHKGSATLTLTRGPLQLFGRVLGRSEVPLDAYGNAVNDPAVFVDSGASVEVVRDLRVSLTAKNLLDKRDAVDAAQYPLPGLSFFAQVAWTSDFGVRR